MGLFKRNRARSEEPDVGRAELFFEIDSALTPEELGDVVEEQAADQGVELVEIDVVGEAYRQAELKRIAGPRDAEGKAHPVGVALRCDPLNEYDRNAIAVEAMGQQVGFIPRDTAKVLSAPMQRACGGVIEGLGVIVGGWDDGLGREGHYGIRVWINSSVIARTGLRPEQVERRG